MSFYLLDHPNPNYPQTRPRSAWGWDGPTGLVGVHTAEGALDRIAPDSGAENVANFIATRSDPGGYHVLCDTDSTIDMAPDHLMTWHIAEASLNGPAWGVSAACRSTEWDPDAEWTRQIIGRMGAAIRAFWLRNGHDPDSPKVRRWLTRSEVLAAGGRIVGLIHHGVVQPSDRSDAWALHPQRARLDQMLLDAIGDGKPNVPEDDMPTIDEIVTALRPVVRQEIDAALDAKDIATNLKVGNAMTVHMGDPIKGKALRKLDEQIFNGVAAIVQHLDADTDSPDVALPPTNVMGG